MWGIVENKKNVVVGAVIIALSVLFGAIIGIFWNESKDESNIVEESVNVSNAPVEEKISI